MTRVPAAVLLAALAVSVGCGKKGPPLAPLRPAPGRIADVQARRRGDRIEIRFTIPSANADGTTPPVIERVEIYSVKSGPGVAALTLAQMMDAKNLRDHVDVRRPRAASDPAPAPGPPDPRLAPGDPATYVGQVTRDVGSPTLTPSPAAQGEPAAPKQSPTQPLPAAGQPPPASGQPPAASGQSAAVSGRSAGDPTLPAPAPKTPAIQYVLVSVAGSRKTPSIIIPVSLSDPPSAPHDAQLTYDEHTLTLEWQPGGASDVFRVYDVDASGRETTGRPVSAAPVTGAKFTAAVQFGKERCLVVRAVQVTGPAAIESDAAGPVCKTPVDTFPPPPPVISTPVVSEGAVSLIWDAVEAPDLAGYLVLRADGANDTLHQLTPAPIVETQYRDATTQPGVQYTYVVAAVDKSTPPNRSESKPVVVIGRF